MIDRGAMAEDTRRETDGLGAMDVPARAYWGIHTQRAIANFPLTGRPVPESLRTALATVKKAACETNRELGFLPAEKAEAIRAACEEILEGRWADQFPVDTLQGGAGTSTHMNMNEVIANRASELMGGARGAEALVRPLEDVNLHQSTNDVFPTAVKIAALRGCARLARAVEKCQGAFQKKESQWAGVVKLGRTQTRDAVPISLGAEFGVFAEALARDRWRVFKSEERLRVVNLGGTAVGTGLTAPRRYIFRVTEVLRGMTNLPLARAENLMDPTANADAFVEVSGILKAHAANVVKICGDLRWMSAFGEIRLPKVQAGSSIMPGKVNPVILEAGIQAGLKAMAGDFLVTEAVSRGTFQICEFLPLLATGLLETLDLLERFDRMWAGHIDGIEADPAACARRVDSSPILFTALLPRLGYTAAEQLAREYERSGGADVREFLVGKFGAEKTTDLLAPDRLLALGGPDEPNA